jgi:Cupredoxin-like domain
MRRLGLIAGSLCLLFAACGGSNPAKHPSVATGGTVAHTTTTLATVATTAEGATTTTAGLTGTAGPTSTTTSTTTATTVAGAACSPSGTVVTVVAKNISFAQHCVAAQANQAFSIDFDNQDAGTPHNIAIYSADPVSHPDAKLLFRGDLTTGPTKTTYHVGAQPAGSYFFHCDVHPTLMSGTFVAA